MSNQNNGGPAFPFHAPNGGSEPQSGGMTLRDYFASKAMQAGKEKEGETE